MATREEDRERIQRLIKTLRSITLSVQITPFIFGLFYIIAIPLYVGISDTAQTLADTMFYISPLAIGAMLVFSHILKLCRWHRIACLLPLGPQVLWVIDYFVAFTQSEAVILDLATSLLIILYIISAYKTFFADGRK